MDETIEEYVMCFLFTDNRKKVLFMPSIKHMGNTVRMLRQCVYGKLEDPESPQTNVSSLFFDKTNIIAPPSKWFMQGTINKYGKGLYKVFTADVDQQFVLNRNSGYEFFDVLTDCDDTSNSITKCFDVQLHPFDEIAYKLALNNSVFEFTCSIDSVKIAKEAYAKMYHDPETKRSKVTHMFYIDWVYDHISQEQEIPYSYTELISAENKDEAEFIIASREDPDQIKILNIVCGMEDIS